jgi:hypothetical protein
MPDWRVVHLADRKIRPHASPSFQSACRRCGTARSCASGAGTGSLYASYFSRSKFFTGCAVLPLLTGYAHADQAATPEDWNAHLQSTYTWQNKHAFAAAYSGPNSLSTNRELSYSWTTTPGTGLAPVAGRRTVCQSGSGPGHPPVRPDGTGRLQQWRHGRASGSTLLYRARVFLRHSWQQDGETEALESAANQLAGTQPAPLGTHGRQPERARCVRSE